jgi:hypothetical protein
MTEIAKLNTSVLGLQGTMESFIKSLGSYETNLKNAKKATADISALQRRLGVDTRDGEKLFNKAGVRVNEYGQEITKVGEVMGNFNKRTSIMNSTIAKFTKDGKAVPFLKGMNVYLKQGGNLLEYFAEFLSSGREELTVFGLEAAKARKVMYGFLPPGMFRLVNKFSSSFQFLGGTMRKLKDNGKGAREELEKYKDELKGMKEGDENFEKISEIVSKLEADAQPNFFTSILTVSKKIGGFIDKKIMNPLSAGTKEVNNKKNPLSWLNAFGKNYWSVLTKISKSPFVAIKEGAKQAYGDTKGLFSLFKERKGLGKQFKEGFNLDKTLKKTQAQIDSIDTKKINKELTRLNNTAEKRAEMEERVRKEIEEYVPILNMNKRDTGNIKQLEAQLKSLEEAKVKEKELAEQLEKKTKLQAKYDKQLAMNKGSNAIKQEIKNAKKDLKTRADRRKEIALEIQDRGKALQMLAEKKKLLEEELKIKQKAGSLTKVQEKELKDQITSTKTKIKKKTRFQQQAGEEAIQLDTDDKNSEETIKNAKEQLKLLKATRKESLGALLNKAPKLKALFGFVKALGGVLPAIKFVFKAAAASFVYVSMAIIAIVVLLKAFGPILKDSFAKAMGVIEVLAPLITFAWTMIKDSLFKIYNAIFGDGSISDLIDGFIELGLGLLMMAVSLAIAGLGVALVFTWELIKRVWDNAWKVILGFFTDSKKMVKGIAMILGIAAAITAIIMGAPVWLAIVIGLAVFKVGKFLLSPFMKVFDFITGAFRSLIRLIKKIPGVATGGTVTSGGLAVVGEEGPELVTLPKGATVYNNKESRRMSTNNGKTSNQVNNINITINAKDTSKAEMDRIAREVSRTITNNIQRQSNTSNLR